MFQLIRNCIFNVLKQFSKTDLDISKDSILIDQPKDKSLGELYTNAAMMFSKKLEVAPRVLAEAIRDALMRNENVLDATIAGPGFVNFKLQNLTWQNVVSKVIQKAENYSYINLQNDVSMNVEFVSANPTGPLHTGHARNAVFGSVAVNLLEKIGYKVTKEFYVNDQGNQIKSLAKSLYLRYRQALGGQVLESDFTPDMYCGAYVKDLAIDLVDIYQDKFLNKDESDWMDFFCQFAIERMMENAKEDLAILGIVMDKYTSEAELCKRKLVDEALAILTECGDIYEGILPRPKGISEEDDWEERPQTLFKSTK